MHFQLIEICEESRSEVTNSIPDSKVLWKQLKMISYKLQPLQNLNKRVLSIVQIKMIYVLNHITM